MQERRRARPADPYPVPPYLPPACHCVLPWARRHVATVARRYHLGPDELWDETITALLRVSLHVDPGPLTNYAKTAIHRACWRYVARAATTRPPTTRLEDAPRLAESMMAPSSEVLMQAHEAVLARLSAPDLALSMSHDTTKLATPCTAARSKSGVQ